MVSLPSVLCVYYVDKRPQRFSFRPHLSTLQLLSDVYSYKLVALAQESITV